MTTLSQKHETLESLLKNMGSVLVAFSGGVDSALVLAVSQEVLGDKVLAVTGKSASIPERELLAAQRLAREIGAEHLIVDTGEMSLPDYRRNPVDRCYHCKTELYTRLSAIAAERNLAHVVNGINLDDLGDHRPGISAARENGISSPLAEAGFNKEDIRELSRELNLSVWEKPAMACLSSRIPYGQPVSPEKLSMIERAEDLLISLGFPQMRVRHHGEIARIELPREDIARFFAQAPVETVQRQFKEIGFKYITLDIEGYRTGRMNEVLSINELAETKPCSK